MSERSGHALPGLVLSRGIVRRPIAPAAVADARESHGGTIRRSLLASVRFGAPALLTAVLLLALLDRVLFDTPLLAAHLPFGNEDGSPTDRLLLAGRYTDARVLYLGDSRVFYGLDPAIVAKACGCGPGFNAGVPGTEPRLTRILAERLLGTLSPDLVVIGLSQWELSDEADILVREPARELLPPWRLDQFGVDLEGSEEVEQAIGSAWRLYRYRGELRRALEEWANGTRRDPDRGFSAFGQQTRLGEQERDKREEQWFDDFSVKGRRADALRGLLAELRGRGIRVVLVAPPLYPDFQAKVRPQVKAFGAAAEKIAADNDATFLDLTDPRRSGLTKDDFRDTVHLSPNGAARFSAQVGRLLRAPTEQG